VRVSVPREDVGWSGALASLMEVKAAVIDIKLKPFTIREPTKQTGVGLRGLVDHIKEHEGVIDVLNNRAAVY